MYKLHILLISLILLSSCTISSDFNRGYLIPAKQQPVSIPFTRTSRLIVLDAKINGVVGTFIFDNGFSYSAVNQSFATRAGINFDNYSSIKDANNKRAKLREATVDSVDINGQIFKDTGFYLVNTLAFLPCDEIDGIIGASIIRKSNWKINFQTKTLQISSIPFKSEGFRLNTHFKNNNTTLTELEIQGKSITTKIDLGSTNSLKLSKKKYINLFQNVLAEKQLGIQSLSATGLGNNQTSYYTKDSYTLGQNKNLLPTSSRVLLRNNLKYEGYLGIDYFDEYEFIINSINNEYLLNLVDDHPIKEREISYGISLYLVNGIWKVVLKDANDKNIQSINAMDTIEKIDGKSIINFKDICSIRKYIKNKTELNENMTITVNNKSYELFLRRNSTAVIKDY